MSRTQAPSSAVVAAIGCLLLGLGPEATFGSGQTEASDASASRPQEGARTGLELRVEAFTDFYFLVRAQAGGVVEVEAELEPIVGAWMPVQEEVGAFGGFWRFDLAGLLSSTPDEFAEWFVDAPETVEGRGHGEIPIRAPGLAMAGAMKSAWPRFRDESWPEKSTRLEGVLERLEREFLPRHREALLYMLDSLGIPDPEIEVPTYLVLEAHPPGADTYRSRTGPIAVLSINDLLGEGRFSDLEETLLHETCHALDLASKGDQDAFSVLRSLLRERGVEEGDPRLRDIPHLVMFAQAENTMRRLYDPNHVAYGDTRRGDIAPLFERSGEAAVVVRRLWSEYLDGRLTRDAALRKIVDEVIGE